MPETPDHHPRTAAFIAACRDLEATHLKKGADYGAPSDPFANISQSADWGIPPWIGAISRGTDKVVRLKAYVRNGSLANEGVEDALEDLAAYCLIALVLFREQQADSEGAAPKAAPGPFAPEVGG